MMNYKEIEITDFKTIDELLKKNNPEDCDHCFSAVYIWSFRHRVEFCIYNETLFLRMKEDGTYWYLSPIGEMSFENAVEIILEQAKADNGNVIIFAINPSQKKAIESTFNNKLSIVEDRDGADYIYKTEDLSFLQGKIYQKKRNHCSRFERENPEYTFNLITKDNIERIKDFEIEWCNKNALKRANDLIAEQKGILSLLDNMDKTDVFGAFIENRNGIVAFTLACPINDKMVDIIVEKAYHNINGAYAVINRDFAKNCLQDYEFINREDDLGYENLRKAKLSYYPFEIKEKYFAEYIVL